MAMISKAALGRYSSSQGLPGPELPREGRRAGGKIEIVHGQEVDPFFANGLDLPSRGRTPGPRNSLIGVGQTAVQKPMNAGHFQRLRLVEVS